MAVITLAEWVPDAAAFGSPGAIQIYNAIPGPTSYKPFPQFVAGTSALDERPRGAISVRDKDNNVFNYVGDKDKLYVQNGESWDDVSRVYGYDTGDDEAWEFVQWKNTVIATNFSDEPQIITLGAVAFDDLTSDFHARHIAVIGDHVFAGNTFDSQDGNVPWRLRWSAFNDEEDWSVDPATGADVRDLAAGGWIQKIIGGEYGVVVSERSTYRVQSVGAPVWFQVDEVLPGVGTIASGSVVALGTTVFFWSEQGVVQLVGATGVAYPGAGRVDNFVKTDLDQSYLARMSAVADPESGRVAWAYPGAGNMGGRPNRILIYDTKLDKWALIVGDFELLWRAGAVGQTIDSLDNVSGSLDDLGASLDSAQWVGGRPGFAAFDTEYQHGFFSGMPMTATVVTKEVELHPGHRTQLNGFRPVVDGGTVTARVGYRSRQADAVSYTGSLSLRDSGLFRPRANGRYHRFELTIAGEWMDAIGVQVDPEDARRAGGR